VTRRFLLPCREWRITSFASTIVDTVPVPFPRGRVAVRIAAHMSWFVRMDVFHPARVVGKVIDQSKLHVPVIQPGVITESGYRAWISKANFSHISRLLFHKVSIHHSTLVVSAAAAKDWKMKDVTILRLFSVCVNSAFMARGELKLY
jgi:hypothetical protein